MRVLVVYATRHGATAGIAARIAAILAGRGLETTVRAAADAGDVSACEAYVVGGAAYMGRRLGELTSFVRDNRHLLGFRPVWLFSSGPVGTDLLDRKGRDVRLASEPREFAEFRDSLRPRGTRVFFGAYDPKAPPVGLAERLTRYLPASIQDQIPAGDFRDWADIEAWANDIADELIPAPAVTVPA
jgi:menaquinone-dependent protoporphyrinogen oxidase